MFWHHKKLWELQKLYGDPDNTIKDIAKYFNVSESAIYQIAAKNFMHRGTYSEEGLKKCPGCKSILPANSENFYKNKTRCDGFETYCKECFRKIKGIKGKKTRLTEYQKKYIINNYGNPSVDINLMANYLGITKQQIVNFAKRARKQGIKIGYRIEREVI